MFGTRDKVALFIDGSNFYATIKELDMNIDYGRVRAYFNKQELLFRAMYFTAVLPDSGENDELRPLVDWLGYNSWIVSTKLVKQYTDRVTNVTRTKGNMDCEITVEMMLLKDSVTHMVLFSGDGDFCHLVRTLQAHGVRVTVVSSKQTQPPMVSNDLRKVCDQFIDLADMRGEFCRSGRER